MTLLGPKRGVALVTILQLAYAHWFFGNLYESVVRIPDRLASGYEPGGEDHRPSSVLSPGSPVRYYLPGIPVLIGGTVWAMAAGWTSRRDRPWLVALVVSTFAGIAATAYVVQTVNRRLFYAGERVPASERDRLLRTWYRVNLARLVAAGVAWLIAVRLAGASLKR